MPNLVLLRHGQSQWNLENRFTGWVDVDLSPIGEAEAQKAGELLRNISIDAVFASALIRAIRTAEIALSTSGNNHLSMEKNQALNERHYGDLQGLDKAETAQKFGDEQVHIWRRSYDVPPPNGESLKMTQERVLPYYHSHIEPLLRKGKNILVVAHGNSLRSLVAELDKLSEQEILQLNIPTGEPILYSLDDNLNVLEKQYLSK